MGDTPSERANVLAHQYFTLAALVILYYDYVLTLPMEVERFWSQRVFSWASFFFYLNRYLSLLGHVPVIMESFMGPTPGPCRHLQTYHQYFAIATQLVVAILLIMRVYALYDQSRRVLVFLSLTVLFAVAFGCWAITSGTKTHASMEVKTDVACSYPMTETESIRHAAAWGGLLVFDIFVFTMTVAKAIKIGRTGQRALIKVLLRDGSVYFLVVVLANLGNILTHVFGEVNIKGMGTAFTNIISAVMISRLMLNLRAPSLIRSRETGQGSTSPTAGYPCVSTVFEGPCDSYDGHGMQLTPEKYFGSDATSEKDIELVSRDLRWR